MNHVAWSVGSRLSQQSTTAIPKFPFFFLQTAVTVVFCLVFFTMTALRIRTNGSIVFLSAFATRATAINNPPKNISCIILDTIENDSRIPRSSNRDLSMAVAVQFGIVTEVFHRPRRYEDVSITSSTCTIYLPSKYCGVGF